MSLRGNSFVDTAHGALVRTVAARARSLRPRARVRRVPCRLRFIDGGHHVVSKCGSAVLRLVGRDCLGRLGDVHKVLCLWGSWSLALLFALLLSPSVSLADTSGSGGGYFGWADMIVDGNTVITEGGYQLQGYVVAASSRYDAACAVLGVDAGSLTPEAETQLSNASTGGQFYAFVQDMEVNEFGNYPAGWAGDTPFLSGLNSVYGVGNVYWIVTGDEAKDGARNDFNTVKNGGSLGGNPGGGDFSDGDYLEFACKTYLRQTANLNLWDGTKWAMNGCNGLQSYYTNNNLLPNDIIVRVPKSIFPNVDYSSVRSGVIAIGNNTDNKIHINIHVCLSMSDSVRSDVQTGFTVGGSGPYAGQTYTYDSYDSVGVGSPSTRSVTFTSNYVYSNGILDITSTQTSSTMLNDYTGASLSYKTVSGFLVGSAGGGGGGGGETNNWPQPTQPNTDSPDVPEPTTPTEPTQPSVDPSDDVTWGTPPQFNPSDTLTPIVTEPTVTIINVTNEPTGTDPTDYTPWLRAILNELKNIHTDLGNLLNGVISAINRVISALNDINVSLSTHCGHIRTAIHNDFDYYVRTIMSQMVSDTDTIGLNIRTQVGWLVQSMRECFSHLEDYLYDLFHWLAEQFDFTFPSAPSYDDRGVIYWLKQIWLKLGTNQYYSPIGPSAPTPSVQDVETGFDWWAWLLSLIDQVFNNVVSDLVEDVDAFVESLREIWPISVPWDLLGAFVLLGASPETPSWTVTIPAVGGMPSYDYVIDLHPYDGLAATVRNMETVVFAFYLLMKSDWLLDLINKGLQKCTVFFDSLVGM